MSVSNCVLAVDIGGSKVQMGLVDGLGQIIKKEREALPPGSGAEYLLGLISEMSRDFQGASLCGAAIPGLADASEGVWLYSPFSGIRNLPIGRLLSEMLGVPAFADNDVNVCALGEKAYGGCRGTDNFLWVTVSNGIGSGLFLDGRLYRGKNNCAGEIGHFIVEEDALADRECGCGRRGCLEAMAAGPGISAAYAKLTGAGADVAGAVGAEEIAKRARAGDKAALAAYERAGGYIGKAAAFCANLLNLEKAVIGGGVSGSYDLLYPAMARAAGRYIMKDANPDFCFEKTALGYDAALAGCGALARGMGGL